MTRQPSISRRVALLLAAISLLAVLPYPAGPASAAVATEYSLDDTKLFLGDNQEVQSEIAAEINLLEGSDTLKVSIYQISDGTIGSSGRVYEALAYAVDRGVDLDLLLEFHQSSGRAYVDTLLQLSKDPGCSYSAASTSGTNCNNTNGDVNVRWCYYGCDYHTGVDSTPNGRNHDKLFIATGNGTLENFIIGSSTNLKASSDRHEAAIYINTHSSNKYNEVHSDLDARFEAMWWAAEGPDGGSCASHSGDTDGKSGNHEIGAANFTNWVWHDGPDCERVTEDCGNGNCRDGYKSRYENGAITTNDTNAGYADFGGNDPYNSSQVRWATWIRAVDEVGVASNDCRVRVIMSEMDWTAQNLETLDALREARKDGCNVRMIFRDGNGDTNELAEYLCAPANTTVYNHDNSKSRTTANSSVGSPIDYVNTKTNPGPHAKVLAIRGRYASEGTGTGALRSTVYAGSANWVDNIYEKNDDLTFRVRSKNHTYYNAIHDWFGQIDNELENGITQNYANRSGCDMVNNP